MGSDSHAWHVVLLVWPQLCAWQPRATRAVKPQMLLTNDQADHVKFHLLPSCLQANQAMGGTHLVFREAGNCCAAETWILKSPAAEGRCSDPWIIAVAHVTKMSMPSVCGRLQVYLGGYDLRDQASRAHDVMVRGPSSCCHFTKEQ